MSQRDAKIWMVIYSENCDRPESALCTAPQEQDEPNLKYVVSTPAGRGCTGGMLERGKAPLPDLPTATYYYLSNLTIQISTRARAQKNSFVTRPHQHQRNREHTKVKLKAHQKYQIFHYQVQYMINIIYHSISSSLQTNLCGSMERGIHKIDYWEVGAN